MLEFEICRKTGNKTLKQIESGGRVDYTGFAKHIASVMKEVEGLQDLRKQVEEMIGAVTNEEWEVATRDVAGNNVMSGTTLKSKDTTMVDKLITSIDYYRRHKGVHDADVG